MRNAYFFQLETLYYYLRENSLNIAPDREFLESSGFIDELEKLNKIVHAEPETIEEYEKQVFFLAEYLEDWFPDDFDDEERESYYNSLINEANKIQRMTNDVSLDFATKNSLSIDHLKYIAEHNKNLSDINREAIKRYIKLKTMFNA